VTAFRFRQKDFEQCFIAHGDLDAGKNVEGPMAAVNIRYKLAEWKLFIDFSTQPESSVTTRATYCVRSVLPVPSTNRRHT
jgi:hypothetical protein